MRGWDVRDHDSYVSVPRSVPCEVPWLGGVRAHHCRVHVNMSRDGSKVLERWLCGEPKRVPLQPRDADALRIRPLRQQRERVLHDVPHRHRALLV